MKLKLALLLFGLFFTNAAWAGTTPAPWLYFYNDQGFGETVAPGALFDGINAKGAGAEDWLFSMQILGLYHPIAQRNLLGLTVDFLMEGFHSNPQGEELGLTQYFLGLSYLHFFGDRIGSGFYLRCDGGVTRTGLTVGDSSAIDEIDPQVFADLGYALPFGRRFSLLAALRFEIQQSASSILLGGVQGMRLGVLY